MKYLFLLFLFVCSLIGNTQTISHAFYFDVDKHSLTANQKTEFKDWIKKSAKENLVSIEVLAYTDTTASKAYNVSLSKRRSSEIVNFLKESGYPNDKIKESYYGESKSTFPSNMQLDRKTEVIFHFEESTVKIESSMRDFYGISAIELEKFCINPERDTVIRCLKGTIIHIKANSFSLKGKPVLGSNCITIEVKEAFLKSEMILENLSTMSDGRILESAGMVYTNAMFGKDSLELIKDIVILLPVDKVDDIMQVFDGERDLHSDVMNWSLSNNSVLQNFNVIDLVNCYRLRYGPCYFNLDSVRNTNAADVLEINYTRCILRLCGGMPCERCKLFFCRFGRILKPIVGTFNKRVRSENKAFRECQRNHRRFERLERKIKRNKGKLPRKDIQVIRNGLKKKQDSGELSETEKELMKIMDQIERTDEMVKSGGITKNSFDLCVELDSLFIKYNVKTSEELVYAINKPLMDKVGAKTMNELLERLPTINLNNIEVAYRNKSLSFDDFKYYVFNSSQLGWKNCDVFADVKEEDKTQLKVNLKPSKDIDCKLVFKKRNFVLPAKLTADNFYFDGIPKNEEAFLVAIKYENGVPYLSLRLITVKDELFEIDFKEMTLQELKNSLKVLDFEK